MPTMNASFTVEEEFVESQEKLPGKPTHFLRAPAGLFSTIQQRTSRLEPGLTDPLPNTDQTNPQFIQYAMGSNMTFQFNGVILVQGVAPPLGCLIVRW